MSSSSFRSRALTCMIALVGTISIYGGDTHAGKPGALGLVKNSRGLMVGPRAAVRPGEWVAYRLTMSAREYGMGDMEVLLKISFPIHSDVEHPLNKDQYWIEFGFSSMQEEEDTILAMKMLVEGDPRDSNAIKRIYLRGGGRTPLEVPLEYLKSEDQVEAACAKGDEKGCASQGGKIKRYKPKKIYTKLGWIRATRMQVTYPGSKMKSDFWVSKKVPVFQIVRAVVPDRMELELDSYGKGALSRIDETKAVPFPDPEELARQLEGMSF